MRRLHPKTDGNQGFTLIEIMVVIAIISILASVAIPNFISYRNKSFCGRAESDAFTIANEIAAYFSIPSHSAIDKSCIPSGAINSKNWNIETVNPNLCITITVQDDSGRCPYDYQQTTPLWEKNVFTKIMRI